MNTQRLSRTCAPQTVPVRLHTRQMGGAFSLKKAKPAAGTAGATAGVSQLVCTETGVAQLKALREDLVCGTTACVCMCAGVGARLPMA